MNPANWKNIPGFLAWLIAIFFPVYGVAYLGWSAFPVQFLYWIENLVYILFFLRVAKKSEIALVAYIFSAVAGLFWCVQAVFLLPGKEYAFLTGPQIYLNGALLIGSYWLAARRAGDLSVEALAVSVFELVGRTLIIHFAILTVEEFVSEDDSDFTGILAFTIIRLLIEVFIRIGILRHGPRPDGGP